MARTKSVAQSHDASLEERDPRRWTTFSFLLITLIAAVYMIDVTAIVGPEIEAGIGVSSTVADLTTSLFLAASGAVIVTAGQLSDRFGPRTMFIIGSVVAIVGIVASAFANGSVLLLGGRALQGIGLALFMVPVMAMVNLAFPLGDRQRGIAFGLFGASFGLGFVLAPLVGGALAGLGTAGWRWSTLLPAVVLVVSIIGVWVLVKPSGASRSGHDIDIIGTVLLGVGLASLIFAFNEAGTYGWLTPTGDLTLLGWKWSLGVSIVFVLFMVALVSLALFAIYEPRRARRGASPLLDVALFDSSVFSRGVIVCALFFAGGMTAILVLPMFFQLVLGLGPVGLGVALLSIGLGIAIAGGLAGPVGERIGSRTTVILGFVLMTAGLAITVPLLDPDSSVLILWGPLFLFGIGFGFTYSKINEIVLGATPKQKSGIGASTMFGVRIVAGAIGAALITALLLGTAAAEGVDSVSEVGDLSTEERAQLTALINSTTNLRQEAGGLSTTAGSDDGTSIQDTQNDAELALALEQYEHDYAAGSKWAIGAIAALLLIGTVVSFTMPRMKKP